VFSRSVAPVTAVDGTSVPGEIYAQPLYFPGLDFGSKGSHNAVFVGTLGNDVYAFDADYPSASAPLWHVNLGPPVFNCFVSDQCASHCIQGCNCRDMVPATGITATPVIDPDTLTLYVVAKNMGSDGKAHYRVHALDARTGAEKFGGPTEISADVPGTGSGSQGGILSFDAKYQLNRPGLLLSKGVLYAAFGAHCDIGPYHGWVIGYDASTLARRNAYATTPNGWAAGIWQSGNGLAADDDGNIYFTTGNGSCDSGGTGTCAHDNFGDSIVRLTPSGTGFTQRVFTPPNEGCLTCADLDLSSAGVTLLRDPDRVVGAGKEGVLYALEPSTMTPTQTPFKITSTGTCPVFGCVGIDHHVHGSPVSWTPLDGSGTLVYFMPEEEKLKAYRVTSGTFGTTPVGTSAMTAPPGMPGGTMSLSTALGGVESAIVWVNLPLHDNANQAIVPGVLRAFNAMPDSHGTLQELWNSAAHAGDDSGLYAKFVAPTVIQGQVFMASFSGALNVYGVTCPGGCSGGQQCVHGTCRPSTECGCTGTAECRGGGCCDWKAECAAQPAGSCARVCGGTVRCPCSVHDECNVQTNRCCHPSCSPYALCGSPDGCGGTCAGECPDDDLECVGSGFHFHCRLPPGICHLHPEKCPLFAEDPGALIDDPPLEKASSPAE
jgi:hypothetical protein